MLNSTQAYVQAVDWHKVDATRRSLTSADNVITECGKDVMASPISTGDDILLRDDLCPDCFPSEAAVEEEAAPEPKKAKAAKAEE